MTGFTRRSNPFIIGVAGGSGSGKTHFARALRDRLGESSCEIVYQDNFYIDQSARFDHDGGAVNFDHPDAIDFRLLGEQLGLLKTGVGVDIPIYDFATHKRKPERLRIEPRPVIIVDGILIFHAADVRRHFDDLVFFETPEELRYRRRLDRDVHERGRTPEGVRVQFEQQVKPMHDAFVAPSMTFAKTIVRDVGEFTGVLEDYHRRLRAVAGGR